MERYCISPGVDREHTVYKYTDQIYKVIQFYSVRQRLGPGARDKQTHYDEKLDSSISRTRRTILEKALCNDWEWFCSLTISAEKHDRTDLRGWWKQFSQWVRDLRKQGCNLQYLIVPEKHADGSWHAHGFLSGIPVASLVSFHALDAQGYRSSKGKRLPPELIDNGYYNWPAYQERFGFCSLGAIDDPVACGFYVSKYISKEQSRMVSSVGLHLYYCSQGLNGAVKHIDFFGRDPAIDALLVNKYDFCATGMTHVKDGCDWTFALDLAALVPIVLSGADDVSAAELEADKFYAYEQIAFDCF